MAVGRGVALIAMAFVLGVVLLNRVDNTPATERVSTGARQAPSGRTRDTVPAATTTTTAPLRAPATVRVLVANGTDVRGAASRVNQEVLAARYNALAPTDADPARVSAVYFTAGFDREAAALAQLLALPPTAVQPLPATPPVRDMRDANVLVVVGAELAARTAPATTTTVRSTATTARATTTTARSATTTTARAATTTTTTTRRP
jgi:hypothetical protein